MFNFSRSNDNEYESLEDDTVVDDSPLETDDNTIILLGSIGDNEPVIMDSTVTPVAIASINPGELRDAFIHEIINMNPEARITRIKLYQEDDDAAQQVADNDEILTQVLTDADTPKPDLVILDLDAPDLKVLDDKYPHAKVSPSDNWAHAMNTLKHLVDRHDTSVLLVTSNYNPLTTPEWLLEDAALRMSAGPQSMQSKIMTFSPIGGLKDINNVYDSSLEDGDDWVLGDPIHVQRAINGDWAEPFTVNDYTLPVSHGNGDFIRSIAKGVILLGVITGIVLVLGHKRSKNQVGKATPDWCKRAFQFVTGSYGW